MVNAIEKVEQELEYNRIKKRFTKLEKVINEIYIFICLMAFATIGILVKLLMS